MYINARIRITNSKLNNIYRTIELPSSLTVGWGLKMIKNKILNHHLNNRKMWNIKTPFWTDTPQIWPSKPISTSGETSKIAYSDQKYDEFLKEYVRKFSTKIIWKRRYPRQIEILQYFRRISSNTRLLNGLTLENVKLLRDLLTRRCRLRLLLSELFFSKIITSQIAKK